MRAIFPIGYEQPRASWTFYYCRYFYRYQRRLHCPRFRTQARSRKKTGAALLVISPRFVISLKIFPIILDSTVKLMNDYRYDSWPDHAVPQAADTLVSLAAEINSLPGPVVVHCSAGIGRTGCFIALATGMIQLLRDGNVDVLGILCQMRYETFAECGLLMGEMY